MSWLCSWSGGLFPSAHSCDCCASSRVLREVSRALSRRSGCFVNSRRLYMILSSVTSWFILLLLYDCHLSSITLYFELYLYFSLMVPLRNCNLLGTVLVKLCNSSYLCGLLDTHLKLYKSQMAWFLLSAAIFRDTVEWLVDGVVTFWGDFIVPSIPFLSGWAPVSMCKKTDSSFHCGNTSCWQFTIRGSVFLGTWRFVVWDPKLIGKYGSFTEFEVPMVLHLSYTHDLCCSCVSSFT